MESATSARTTPAPRRRLRFLLAGLLALGLLLVAAPQWLESKAPRGLVFVFVFDALRADHLSQYGYPRATSPGLDALASVATLFENAYAPSSYTTASTASLFTGLAPLRHGASRQGAQLDSSHETFAEVLERQGYVARGVSFNPVVASATGFTQGFTDFVERERGSPFNLYPDIAQGLERVRGWLDEHPDESQLFYFQIMNTHGPYLVPKAASTTLLGRPPRPEFQYYRAPMGEILAGQIEQRASVTPAYVDSAIERYDTAIRYATDQLGQFLAEQHARGRLDEALVIVTADHGDEFFEHGGFSHGYTLHEEVVRVPLLIKLPGQRAKRRVPGNVSLMDVLPTLADAVGASVPADLDGRSLLPLLVEQPAETLAAAGPSPALHFSVDFPPRLVAGGLIEGRHKLIAIERNYEGAERELRLYDLTSDPGEHENLAARDPARTQSMLTRLIQHDRSQRSRAPTPGAVAPDLDRERLRALGYVE